MAFNLPGLLNVSVAISPSISRLTVVMGFLWLIAWVDYPLFILLTHPSLGHVIEQSVYCNEREDAYMHGLEQSSKRRLSVH
jgi:hypothetical protein